VASSLQALRQERGRGHGTLLTGLGPRHSVQQMLTTITASLLLLASSGRWTTQDTIRVRADGPPAWGTSVRLVHEFTIGQLDGPPEYAFGRIDRLAADRSGGFYVFDGAETQIRRYDARGRFVTAIGRKGAGPGEYQSVEGMALLGDSLLVTSDPVNSRITLFELAGGVRHTFRIGRSLFIPFTGERFAIDTAGLIYLTVPVPGGRQEGYGVPYQFLRLRPTGAILDSLPVPPASTAPDAVLVLGFREETISTPSLVGGMISGHNAVYRFTVRSPTGRVLVVERAHRRLAVAGAERDEWVAMAAFISSRQGRTLVVPTTKPAFRELRSDRQGRVWMRLYTVAEKRQVPPRSPGDSRPPRTWLEPAVYDVFAPLGGYLGRVELPAETTLMDVSRDRVYLLMRGPEGEHRVGVYHLDVRG
jgi:6-bladed beta-propeller protein